jgi:hypothetical protein
MKKILFISLMLSTIVLASYITKIKVVCDYDKKTDFSGYKSFAWIAPYDTGFSMHRKDKPYGNYIIRTCDNELFKKGMKLDTINPDVVFMFDTHYSETVEYKKSPTTSIGIGVYTPGYFGQNYYGGPSFDPNGYNMGASIPNNNRYPANATGYWGGYYYGGSSVSVPVGGGKVSEHRIETGALIINMYDAKTRKYIWGAVADDDQMDITTDIPLTINMAVKEMLQKLPIVVNK